MKCTVNSSTRITWFVMCVAFSLILVFPTVPLANPSAFPERSIEVVVPFPPGGVTDLVGRILGESLSKKWRKPVTVLNKPGGNAVIGTNYVMQAAPDGYTVLVDGGATSSLQSIIPNLPFKWEERTFLANAVTYAGVFVVSANSPWKSLNDVAEAAKKDPTSFTWAGLGGGTQSDYHLKQFFAAAKIDVSKTKNIVFTGGGPAYNAIAGGHVQFGTGGTNSALPLLNSGLLRVVAVISSKRIKYLPNVPTTSEQGFPVTSPYWNGFSGPPGLPEELIKVWSQAIEEVLSYPELLSKLDKLTMGPMYIGGGDFKKFVLEQAQGFRQFLETK